MRFNHDELVGVKGPSTWDRYGVEGDHDGRRSPRSSALTFVPVSSTPGDEAKAIESLALLADHANGSSRR